MMSFEDSLRCVRAVLQKSRAHIQNSDESIRPVLRLNYMIIYTAIQDAFNYPTIRYRQKMKSSQQKASIRYVNSRKRAEREEARDWLRSSHAETLWRCVSDVPFETMRDSVDALIKAMIETMRGDSANIDGANELSREVSRMLKGLSY